MSSQDYLPHFITEELYLISEKDQTRQSDTEDVSATHQEVSAESKSEAKEKKHIPLHVLCKVVTDKERILLGKVLGAVGHTMEDTKITESPLEDQMVAEKTLIFTDQIPDGGAYYQIQQLNDSPTLYSRPLAILENNIDDKKALWTSLKSWFAIN